MASDADASDASSSSDDAFVTDGHYRCASCGAHFYDSETASEHANDMGSWHRFIEVLEPRVGDHIYIAQYDDLVANRQFRSWETEVGEAAVDLLRLPEHHGVVVPPGAGAGEDDTGRVVHFDCCSRGVLTSGDGRIARVSLAEFQGIRTLFLMRHERRLPHDEAAFRALWALSKGGFNCQTFTCEHFAAWCCTGSATSHQAWYAAVYVDPVFPLGWIALMAKDAAHTAADWWAEAERTEKVCVCGRRFFVDGVEDCIWCDAGHPNCWSCLRDRARAACPAAWPPPRPAAGGADAGPTSSCSARLCCLQPACWAPLQVSCADAVSWPRAPDAGAGAAPAAPEGSSRSAAPEGPAGSGGAGRPDAS